MWGKRLGRDGVLRVLHRPAGRQPRRAHRRATAPPRRTTPATVRNARNRPLRRPEPAHKHPRGAYVRKAPAGARGFGRFARGRLGRHRTGRTGGGAAATKARRTLTATGHRRPGVCTRSGRGAWRSRRRPRSASMPRKHGLPRHRPTDVEAGSGPTRPAGDSRSGRIPDRDPYTTPPCKTQQSSPTNSDIGEMSMPTNAYLATAPARRRGCCVLHRAGGPRTSLGATRRDSLRMWRVRPPNSSF